MLEPAITAAITTAITDHFGRTAQAAVVQEGLHRFQVEEKFDAKDLYWKGDVRGSRFESTLETGILYRPGIVDDLIQQIRINLEKKVRRGIMVKGPPGIGKSHSIVNLVLKLIYGSNNEYLVTFIPDCEHWFSVVYLLRMICESCGIPFDLITPKIKGNHVLDKILLKELVANIDQNLESKGKKWIFVFDQINRLFARVDNINARDVGNLVFPYNFIKQIMKASRITSVISASANNEIAYKERHEGFEEYLHVHKMDKAELLELSDSIDENNVDFILSATSGVPLFTSDLIEKELDIQAYENEIILNAEDSLRKLKEDERHSWGEIIASTISSLLLVDTTQTRYDKKFLLQEEIQYLKYRYIPLVPQVLTGYRGFIWNELMTYVEDQEKNLLNVCKQPSTSNKVRGCHFETMVIRRCRTMNTEINLGFGTVVVPSLQYNKGFYGKKLPNEDLRDGLHFPFDPNFPAIDFFLQSGKRIFAIQVHVTTHDDVSDAFIGLCNQAGWFQRFDHIELIYLSPENAVTNLVTSLVNPPIKDALVTRQEETPRRIQRRAISKDSFSCLQDLQWPEGCSLPST